VNVTDRDRESARALARAFYDVASPEARDKAEDVIAYRLAAEREWALKPFRDLEDGYPLGTDVPVYRISRAIEEVERS
jgi:hypothetical protein